MSAFKRFTPEDQFDNVLILHPSYDVTSGSQGWRGSPEGSSSMSLYGGARRRPGIFSSIEYQSFAPNASQVGNPTRGQPLTASINFAYATDDELGLSQITSTRWGREHWDVLQRLYQDYRVIDPDYVTGSYDYYCLYFNKDSKNIVVNDLQDSDTNVFLVPTGSFTLESWVKPFLTSSASQDFTIQSMNSSFWFGLTGSNGALVLSSSAGTLLSSSQPLLLKRWNHVAVSYDSSSQTGSMYVNSVFAGMFTGSTPITGSPNSFLSIGNRVYDDAAPASTLGSYPLTKTTLQTIVGGDWDAGYLFDEPTGSAFPTFSSSSVSHAGVLLQGIPPFRVAGPLSGSDLAIRLTSPSGTNTAMGFSAQSTVSFDVSSSDDYAWLGIIRFNETGSAGGFNRIFSKSPFLAGQPFYQLAFGPGVSSFGSGVQFNMSDGTSTTSIDFPVPLNQWGVLGTVFDRTAGQMRVGFAQLNGETSVSSPASFTGTNTSNGGTWQGPGRAVSNSASLDVAAMYIGTSPGCASGMSMNLSSVLNALRNVIAPSNFGDVTGTLGYAFDGLIGETRYWDSSRSVAQIISSAGSRLTGTSVGGPLSYAIFNEGPLSHVQSLTLGSGCLDYAGLARGRSGDYSIGVLRGFNDRVGPTWHPNDNVSFIVPKLSAPISLDSGITAQNVWGPNPSDSVRRMLIINIPSAFHGRQIVPGSIRMVCRAFESFGFIRTIVDDGRGGLYLSGSICSSSLADREEYAGVGWNKIGNVFYGEGLIAIKDPSLLDFGRTDGAALVPTDTFSLSFKGDSRIPVKTLMCRIDHGEFNCTTNQTFFMTGSAGERLRRHPSGSIRVTTVGVYNSNRELVAVARLADPVRIRARDRINIKLKIDF